MKQRIKQKHTYEWASVRKINTHSVSVLGRSGYSGARVNEADIIGL